MPGFIRKRRRGYTQGRIQFKRTKYARTFRKPGRSRRYGRRSYRFGRRRYGRRVRSSFPSRAYKATRMEFFRGLPTVFGKVTHLSGLALANGATPGYFFSLPQHHTLFNNQCLQYEKVKFISSQFHYWIKQSGLNQDPDAVKIFEWKSYDSDDTTIQTTATGIKNIQNRMNCKFKRLNFNKTYKQTITPRWASLMPNSDISDTLATFRNGRHDNPWWDTSELYGDKSPGKPKVGYLPSCNRGYKFYWANQSTTEDAEIEGYTTWIVAFKGEKRSGA